MRPASQGAESLPQLNSPIMKRSVVVGGRKTSVSLEDAFWDELRKIAAAKRSTISDLMGEIDDRRGVAMNLSSCVRLFVLQHLRDAADRVIADRAAADGDAPR
jgi:predicted DNA-binding ribbon-helix-helix protein